MPEPYDRLLGATAGLDTPFAVIDEPALWANAEDLVRRAGGVPIRVASKSVRVRSIIERTLARNGFAGVMSYSLAEAVWLVDHGIDDILLAYPTTSRTALTHLIGDDRRRAQITLMVDSIESLDHIDNLVGTDHPAIRVCIDVDASLKIGPAHLGVRRSPVHSVEQARTLAATIAGRAGFDLVGVLFYAQRLRLPPRGPVPGVGVRPSPRCAAVGARRATGVVRRRAREHLVPDRGAFHRSR